ncbi:hypothetical protein [Erwinia aphidicola]
MKKLLLLLLLLSSLVQAADWLSWRTVGQATLTWGRSPSTTHSC